MSNGDCLMLENIGENVEAVLDALLGRLTIKKGKYIKIGDREVEFHPKFRLILQVGPPQKTRLCHLSCILEGNIMYVLVYKILKDSRSRFYYM